MGAASQAGGASQVGGAYSQVGGAYPQVGASSVADSPSVEAFTIGAFFFFRRSFSRSFFSRVAPQSQKSV